MRGTTATISERRRQVAKLTEGGASLREVGAALGTSHVTVSRDFTGAWHGYHQRS